MILLDSLPDTPSSCSFSRANKGAIYEFKLRKHRQKTNHDAKTNNSDVEKSNNCRKQNLENEANSMQLDKEDTQRSNLNSKYLRATLFVLKSILVLLFVLPGSREYIHTYILYLQLPKEAFQLQKE